MHWCFQLLLLPVLAGTLPRADFRVEEEVDLMEVNHFFSDTGQPVYDQVILWRSGVTPGLAEVAAWWFLKPELYGRQPVPRPAGGAVCVFWDWNGRDPAAAGQDRSWQFLRTVRAATWIESWTQYDPELADRQRLPASARRGLLVPPPRLRLDFPPPPQVEPNGGGEGQRRGAAR